jgi:aspartyl-tRNA synthetase
MLRTHYAADVSTDNDGDTVSIAGWIEETRNLGGIAFILLRDKTGVAQITCIKKEMPELFARLTELPRESVIAATGTCQKNDQVQTGWELLPSSIEVLSEAQTPLPMGVADQVNVDFDTRLDNRFIDVRRDEVQAIFAIRHTFIESTCQYLTGEGFTHVHTPKITVSSPEGGTELFTIDYFGRDAYLVQSPQVYKQMLMATGLDRVYEIAWYFRAEEHDTSKHLNESTAIDVEMAFIQDDDDVMTIIEGMVTASLETIEKRHRDDLKRLDVELPSAEPPFRRIPYDEVIDILSGHIDIEWGDDLGTDEENLLGEQIDDDFYFITRFPLETKPFYAMPDDDHARAFDLACRGTEICSGAQRIHDPALLEQRIADLGLNPDDFAEYLKAFRYGMPPHGGFGFGIERYLMKILRRGNVRECILFPRDKKRLTP